MGYEFEIIEDVNEKTGESFWLAKPIIEKRLGRDEWKALQQSIYDAGGKKYYPRKKGFPFYTEEKPELSQPGTASNSTGSPGNSTHAISLQPGTLPRNSRHFDTIIDNAENIRYRYSDGDTGQSDIDSIITAARLKKFIGDHKDWTLRYDGNGQFHFGHYWMNAEFTVGNVKDRKDPAREKYLKDNFYTREGIDLNSKRYRNPENFYPEGQTPPDPFSYKTGDSAEFFSDGQVMSGTIVKNDTHHYTMTSESWTLGSADKKTIKEEKRLYTSFTVRVAGQKDFTVSTERYIRPKTKDRENFLVPYGNELYTPFSIWQKLLYSVSYYHSCKKSQQLARLGHKKEGHRKKAEETKAQIAAMKEGLLKFYTRPGFLEHERYLLGETEQEQALRIELWENRNKEQLEQEAKRQANLANAFFKTAESYRKASSRKFEELEHKLANTPKRLREYRTKNDEAENEAELAAMYQAIGEARKAGSLPQSLEPISPVKSKQDLYEFTEIRDEHFDTGRIKEPIKFYRTFLYLGENAAPEELKRLGINKLGDAEKMYADLRSIMGHDPEEKAARRLQEEIGRKVDAWRFKKEKGFFPTPMPLAERMVKTAGIEKGMDVLEPSAGLGHIAEAIRGEHPGANLDVVERFISLQEVLDLKGFNVVGSDFLDFSGKQYDRIVMNPPFEKLQDIDHVKHAFSLLRPGGRIVAIMGESAFFNTQKKAVAFREWLEETGATSEQLPDSSFMGKDAFRQTGVSTRLVVIDKEQGKEVQIHLPAPQKTETPVQKTENSPNRHKMQAEQKNKTTYRDMLAIRKTGETISQPGEQEELGRKIQGTSCQNSEMLNSYCQFAHPSASIHTGEDGTVTVRTTKSEYSYRLYKGIILRSENKGGSRIWTVYRQDWECTPVKDKKEKTQAGKLSPVIYGREQEINLPNGEKHRATFAIVELGNITASHNEHTFAPNPNFPTENDRSYHTDRNAQAVVEQVAQKLDPSLVLTTSSTPEGTPIITPDGFVVSGNNRTMSLKLAASKYPGRYQAYVDYLLDECWVFKNQCERISEYGIKQPVLVRIDYDFGAYTTENMAKYNKATMKAESPTDRAVKLSRIVRENTRLFEQVAAIVSKYETFTELYSKAAEQKNLVGLLVTFGIWTQAELPQYYDGSSLTAQGKEFTETILSAMVLEKEALQATSLAGVKKLRQMLITSLPVLVANANLPEGNLNAALNEAILLQSKMTRSGLSFADVLRQAEMFGGDKDKWTKKACYLNRLLQLGKIKFKKSFEAYNTGVKNEQDSSLFGDKKTPGDIFKTVIVSQVPKVEQYIIENSPLVTCCKKAGKKQDAETLPDLQDARVPRLNLTPRQREKIKTVKPKDPAPETQPDTLKAAKKILKEFLGQVQETGRAYQDYQKLFAATVAALAKLDSTKEKTDIGTIRALYAKKKQEAKYKLDMAAAKVKAQGTVYENAPKGEKSGPLKELRKLRTELERANDRHNNVEKQMDQRIARLMKRNALREKITSVKQAEALPMHRTNKAVLALVNAAAKQGADFSEFKEARNRYAKLFRELPMKHVRALENIKGAQAKFLGYINGLGELLGKKQEHAGFYTEAFNAQVENFAAIGLVLEEPELAKFIRGGEPVSLEKLQEKAETLIKKHSEDRARRAALRLNAYEQLQKLA